MISSRASTNAAATHTYIDTISLLLPLEDWLCTAVHPLLLRQQHPSGGDSLCLDGASDDKLRVYRFTLC